jgi:hypothetical protein
VAPRTRITWWAQRAVGRQHDPELHPDHVLVRDLALSTLAQLTNFVPLLYEELPYLWAKGANGATASRAGGHHWRAELIAMPVDRAAKARRIALYSSQVAQLSVRGRRVESAEDLPTVERYWRLSHRNRAT